MALDNAPSKESLFSVTNESIDAARSELVDISLDIHAHPELN